MHTGREVGAVAAHHNVGYLRDGNGLAVLISDFECNAGEVEFAALHHADFLGARSDVDTADGEFFDVNFYGSGMSFVRDGDKLLTGSEFIIAGNHVGGDIHNRGTAFAHDEQSSAFEVDVVAVENFRGRKREGIDTH